MGRSLLLFVFVIAAFFKMTSPLASETSQESIKQKTGNTIIYLVRHAEKVTTDPQDEDPELTAAGFKRAEDLKQFLKNEDIDAFFTTPYKRNQLTLSPVAQGRKLLVYDAHDFKQLKERILRDYKGKTVLVVGHSNTLLPIIEAFGGKKPMTQITDSQYDNIFKLTISSQGKVQVEAQKFGVQSA
ncbi:MAG: histidine phosphatase family protein [Cytophagales bacterium CG18_big_fil_WC_8_21_14_2_50_42_9]|nr:MAG: histidine phosphatase family protein [Cytophagales bacterium CG18_big_fil_WC_8_21_14_2_50_42_9]